tara:strand:- start:682 stop:1287 length:606 start_codon:yes stop_codon:yes gene_type:complete
MIKLKTILEKFDSKAQQRFLYATDPKAAKEKGEKMTKKDYEELPDKVNEGIDFQAILLKDAMLKYNNKPTGGIPRTLQFVGSSYVKVPKGTFLIGLPGGLFAVNMKKKFAMALTSGSRTYLDAQDKLKDSDVGRTNMAPEFSQWKQYLNESDVTESKVNEISPGPFGITMAIGVILKALLKWYQQANSSDKKKLKKFVDDL